MSKYPFQFVDYSVDRQSKIATVVFTNPTKANAAPAFAEEQLIDAVEEWEKDDDVKVVIVKGKGENFCGGHDVGSYNEVLKVGRDSRHNLRDSLKAQRDIRIANRRLLFSLKPTIAEVRGLCIEWGNALAVCCDMTIAANDAHFGNLGQTGGISGITAIRLYIALIGFKRMREMMVSGRTWSGKDASAIGLVNRSVPAEQLEQEVLNEARRIALLPLDGIVVGKAYTHLVYEAMGFGQGFTENSYFHTLGLKLKFEPDDFAFFKELQRTGVSDAVRKRKELYEPLGGFGQRDERPIIRE